MAWFVIVARAGARAGTHNAILGPRSGSSCDPDQHSSAARPTRDRHSAARAGTKDRFRASAHAESRTRAPIATEFLLGEYVHLLQSRLQRYGDHIAGLGFDATEFLDEKIEIFEGIRERASLSIRGMPKELENLFISTLNISSDKLVDASAQRQQRIQSKLRELSEETETA